jgi:hypothetical protein
MLPFGGVIDVTASEIVVVATEVFRMHVYP